VVVSEETGSISLVRDGRLERGISPDALRTELRSLLGDRRTPLSSAEPRSSLA